MLSASEASPGEAGIRATTNGSEYRHNNVAVPVISASTYLPPHHPGSHPVIHEE
jgi:hypothetical protein